VRSPAAGRWPEALRNSGWHCQLDSRFYRGITRFFAHFLMIIRYFNAISREQHRRPARPAASDQRPAGESSLCAEPWWTDDGRVRIVGHRGRAGRRCLRHALRAMATTRRRPRPSESAFYRRRDVVGIRRIGPQALKIAGKRGFFRCLARRPGAGNKVVNDLLAVRRSFPGGNSWFAISVINARRRALTGRLLACDVDEHRDSALTDARSKPAAHCHRWRPKQKIFERAMTISERALCGF
jgi:hypothetical protein